MQSIFRLSNTQPSLKLAQKSQDIFSLSNFTKKMFENIHRKRIYHHNWIIKVSNDTIFMMCDVFLCYSSIPIYFVVLTEEKLIYHFHFFFSKGEKKLGQSKKNVKKRLFLCAQGVFDIKVCQKASRHLTIILDGYTQNEFWSAI